MMFGQIGLGGGRPQSSGGGTEPPAPVPSIVLAPAGLQSFEVGVAVSLNLAPLTTIQNSTDAATYTVVSGSLPAGLSLSSAGLISGTPTATGAFAAQIRAALPTGQADQQTVAFSAPAPVLSFADQDPCFYETGVAFSRVLNGLISVDGAPSTALNVAYSLAPGSTLPPGLMLGASQLVPGDPITHTIQGTPTGLHVDGQYAVVVIRATYQGATVDIPVFFCDVSLDRDAVISGGTEFDYEWGGVNLRRYRFTTSGTFNVVRSGWFDYVVVGGGGPGGSAVANNGGGGGGGGGVRRGRIWFPAGTYTITIGAGGAVGAASGGESSIAGAGVSTISASGGLAGATASSATAGTSAAGGSSSSGGGGAAGTSTSGAGGAITGGAGFGTSGGSSVSSASGGNAGGGGGYGALGGSGNSLGFSGHGGGGLKINFTATNVFVVACGGGGGARNGGVAGVSGVAGFGTGSGGGATNTAGGAGQANTGNGGGGGGGGTTPGAGGAGGSGAVMLWTRRP